MNGQPGWYPDPWSGGHHRYWDGRAWTADVFADVPTAGPGTTPGPPPACLVTGQMKPFQYPIGAIGHEVIGTPTPRFAGQISFA